MSKMKTRLYSFLNSAIGGKTIALLIFLSLLFFALETEYQSNVFLNYIGIGIAAVFGLEYLSRIWVADIERPEGETAMKSRIKYMTSFYGILDLVAFLPALIIPAASGSVVLRVARVTRLLHLMKFKPLTEGIRRTSKAIRASKNELLTSMFICGLLIFLGAVIMYLVEGQVQPDAFGSIPRALWWSLATLTTVGYGDVYPITALGRFVASTMAIVGIGAVALPAGILAAAFTKANHFD